jgi:hypothetical protein
MEVKWTYDERVDDGLAAWYALRHFKTVMEDPESAGVVLEAVPAGALAPDAPGASTDNVETAPAPVES